MRQGLVEFVHQEAEEKFVWHIRQAERHLVEAEKLLNGPARFKRSKPYRAALTLAQSSVAEMLTRELKLNLERRKQK